MLGLELERCDAYYHAQAVVVQGAIVLNASHHSKSLHHPPHIPRLLPTAYCLPPTACQVLTLPNPPNAYYVLLPTALPIAAPPTVAPSSA